MLSLDTVLEQAQQAAKNGDARVAKLLFEYALKEYGANMWPEEREEIAQKIADLKKED